MNRATATTAANLDEKQMTTRKRKSRTSSENSLKEETTPAAVEKTSSDTLSNRKSTRIKNNNKSGNVVLVVPKINKDNNANVTSTSGTEASLTNKSQLNGAQFFNAASLNTTAKSTGNISFKPAEAIGVDAQTDLTNKIDLNKLSEKVEDLSKKLDEHTSLFKRLTNIVDRLSSKLDESINNDSQPKRNNNNQKRKNQNKKDHEVDDENDEEKQHDEVYEDDIIEPKKKRKKQNENDSSIQNDDIEELINQNKTRSNEIEKSVNLTLPIVLAPPASPSPSNSPSKLIKLKLDDLPPSLNEEIETVVSASLIEMKNSFMPSNQISELNNIQANTNNIKTSFTTISNNDNNNNDRTHYASESSHSDRDDEDDYEDEDGGGKKSSRSSSSNNSGTKNGTIAILNKTKIDTEFISNLIANKDPNDKRYDANEINKLRLLSHSYQNFAVKLLCRLFDEEEIIGRNVYGRNYSGDKTIMKQPLDPERINFIKETVLRLTKTNNPDLAWASCVIAMNRKMVDVNNKYLKGLKE